MAKGTTSKSEASVETIGEVSIDLSKPKTFMFRLADNRKVKSQGRTETGETDPEYPPKYWIDNPTGGISTVDPETNKPRLLRYLKGYETVWVDEQGKIEKEQLPNLIEEFLMLDGVMRLDLPVDYSKLKFLLLYPSFDKNAKANGKVSSFYLVNDDAAADKEFEKIKLRSEAEEAAIDLEIEKLESIASFFGVKLQNDDGTKRKENAIRLDLAKKAAAQPDVFLKALEDEKLRLRYVIQKAVQAGTIDLNKTKGQAHWGETGALITALDADKHPLDALADFALGTKAENKAFANKLGL